MKYMKTVSLDAVATCPVHSLQPWHYRIDGKCQCDTGLPDFRDTQQEQRGHDFLPLAGTVPGLYVTQATPAGDKLIGAHYFCASGDWWVAEIGPADDGLAFGYAKLAAFPDGAEWGYISLAELEAVSAHGGLVIVERDLDWTPKKFSEIRAAQR